MRLRRIGRILGLPLEDQPLMAADPVISLKIACEYWKDRKINMPAEHDDLITVTRLVNGGLNGLEDRRAYLKKAKEALAEIEAIGIGMQQQTGTPVLRRGSWGDAVGKLQTLLRAKGYLLAVDNEFGPATELAVTLFQRQAGLEADGIVGERSWAALRG